MKHIRVPFSKETFGYICFTYRALSYILLVVCVWFMWYVGSFYWQYEKLRYGWTLEGICAAFGVGLFLYAVLTLMRICNLEEIPMLPLMFAFGNTIMLVIALLKVASVPPVIFIICSALYAISRFVYKNEARFTLHLYPSERSIE